jgi:hypothetical protein
MTHSFIRFWLATAASNQTDYVGTREPTIPGHHARASHRKKIDYTAQRMLGP